MYKSGRFLSLTDKALNFIEALKTWAKEKGIPESDIPVLLEKLSQEQGKTLTLDEALASLIEKGFMKGESLASDSKRMEP